MKMSSMPGSMFEDPVLQELVRETRNRFGHAGLAVLAELCRRELNAHPAPSLVEP